MCPLPSGEIGNVEHESRPSYHKSDRGWVVLQVESKRKMVQMVRVDFLRDRPKFTGGMRFGELTDCQRRCRGVVSGRRNDRGSIRNEQG